MAEAQRPICEVCGVHPVEKSGCGKYWRKKCRSCRKRPYTIHKKDACEICGFVAEHRCQLDVDHIDGDKKNNDPSNLRTVCANCHRLETYQKKHFLNRKDRGLE